MKDLITKATFGFLMAQLFPGAVTVFALSFIYFTVDAAEPRGLLSVAEDLLRTWNRADVAHQLFLIALCIGAGMFVHGVHWATLGHLEHRYHRVSESAWHKRRLIWQWLLAPAQLVAETMGLLFLVTSLNEAEMEENVPEIDKDRMPQFEFLEDFYLYSAQFFAHTSYALASVFVAAAIFIVVHGFTLRRAELLLFAYLLLGASFVLGRIQLRTLFTAEMTLRLRSQGAPLASGS